MILDDTQQSLVSFAYMGPYDRDVLSPREVAERAGFSYHAILRAIRRGDLQAFEPVPGRYRISVEEYERWLSTPVRPSDGEIKPVEAPARRFRPRRHAPTESAPGSRARLEAIEARS
jgi:hypothetical protein